MMTSTDDGRSSDDAESPPATPEPAATSPAETPAASPTPTPAAPAKPASTGKAIGGCLVLVVIVGGLLWACTSMMKGNSSNDDSTMAYVMCQNQVDKQLKAPATAGYPLTTEFTINKVGDTYTMDAWVDAQNSFGAQVRTFFHCNAKKMGGDTWGVTATLQQ